MKNAENETEWLQSFITLHNEAAMYIRKVEEGVNSEDEQATDQALKDAVLGLPAMLVNLKTAPDPKNKEYKDIKKKFQRGLKVFIEGCNYGITYFETPSPWNRSVWWLTAETATKQLKEVSDRLPRNQTP
ncbi:hypothetical protein DGWBC_0156 [Dehalogenimonas sp. WBC-2]|nr:hypothetical protein DGWBC_0156 [Dehalogenimonas sp. WBC-2]